MSVSVPVPANTDNLIQRYPDGTEISYKEAWNLGSSDEDHYDASIAFAQAHGGHPKLYRQ